MKTFKSTQNKDLLVSSGYTLIEMLVVIALVSIVGIVISKFQRDVFYFNRYFSSSFSTADNAQKLLRPMTAEIRSASTSNSGAYPIDSIGDYSFSFYSDADNDGQKELIKYSLSGTTITKETTKPSGTPPVYLSANKTTKTFMTGVRNISDGVPVFTYYDGTYTGGAGGVISSSGDLSAIRLVGIKIRIDPDQNQSPTTTEVSTQVSIRNLKIQQ